MAERCERLLEFPDDYRGASVGKLFSNCPSETLRVRNSGNKGDLQNTNRSNLLTVIRVRIPTENCLVSPLWSKKVL